MKSCILTLCLLIPCFSLAQKEVCFSIDDLPVVNYGNNSPGHVQEITDKLLKTFDEYGIPAIGFVNERKLYTGGDFNPEQIDLIKRWLRKGYELGNHTYSHMNYHTNSYEDYTHDILLGEKITKPLAISYGLSYSYFRHPYLRIGNSKGAHDSLRYFLHMHQYMEAPVSIDNEDYLFAKAYAIAARQGDDSLMQQIGKDFIDYMESKLIHFEQQAHKLFDRNIKHILLLHANLLNADYLDELASMYQSHGYHFVSMSSALEDEAYMTEISSYGNWGISWLDRWALSQGKKGDFFKGDPRTPEYIVEMTK